VLYTPAWRHVYREVRRRQRDTVAGKTVVLEQRGSFGHCPKEDKREL